MVSDILVGFVAIIQTYFMILEMLVWSRPRGLKIFRQTKEQADATRLLAANQGLYNGFLAAGLVWGLVHPDAGVGFQIQVFFLACVMIAGLYGAATVMRKILYVQFLPALVASVFLFINKFS